jgi:hypothetical protein
MIMTYLPIILALVLQATNGTLHGKITDEVGGVIGKAHILIHWDASGSAVGLRDNVGQNEDVTQTSDDKGEFDLALPPGFYDVCVMKDAFSPTCSKVRVKSGKTLLYQHKMKVDASVSKELD